MTREEFFDEICNITDIYNFCLENGYETFVEDWIPGDFLDERIESDLSEYINDYLRSNYWYQLADALDVIERNCSMYRCGTGWFEYEEIDSEFDSLLSDLLDELDADGFFDDEQDDEGVTYSEPANCYPEAAEEEHDCNVEGFLLSFLR